MVTLNSKRKQASYRSRRRMQVSMILNLLNAKLSILPHLFQASYDVISSPLSFSQRWCLLLLQAVNILTTLITAPSWLFNSRSTVLYVPTRSRKKCCLIYQPPQRRGKNRDKRADAQPLHMDIHGGGFIGGFPEHGARWCAMLSDQTGTVVISCSYRLAPRYIFPAAHDGIDNIVSWILSACFRHQRRPNSSHYGWLLCWWGPRDQCNPAPTPTFPHKLFANAMHRVGLCRVLPTCQVSPQTVRETSASEISEEGSIVFPHAPIRCLCRPASGRRLGRFAVKHLHCRCGEVAK
jgi:hypothetical protein